MKELLKLYNTYSVSRTKGEKEICDFLEQWMKEHNILIERKGCSIYHYKEGNKVLLSAHLDQVDTNGRAEHFYMDDKKVIRAYNSKMQRTSLGADDKNGVWIILQLLKKGYEFDFTITESEEIGCVGIKNIEDTIKDSTASIALVLDRRGTGDILKGGGSDVYCECLAANLKNFLNIHGSGGYSVTTGSLSDTRVLCKYIEAINMSVAYEGAHTANETTDFERLKEILLDVELVLKSFVHYPSRPENYLNKENTATTKYTNYYKYYGGY